MNDLGNLLQMIYDLLSGWFTSFTSHATAVMEKLNLIEDDTDTIVSNTSDIADDTNDIKDNTGAIITPVQSIKTNTDSIKNDTTTIKNNVSTMSNQLGTISTNVGTASAFTEDVANNTLDIKNRIVTIGSDTTQLRSNSNTITSDVSDIKTALNYYLANTPVTEDVEDNICNFDTDLTDYLQACNVTIPADQIGFSGITLTKCGKNVSRFGLDNIVNSQFVSVQYINSNSFNTTTSGVFSRQMYLIRLVGGTGKKVTISFKSKGILNGYNVIRYNRTNSYANYTNYGGHIVSSSELTEYTKTLVLEDDFLYVSFYWNTDNNSGEGTAIVEDFQIEYAENQTTFEAYKSNNYNVSFGTTITDGAEINLLDGIVKVNSTPVSYLSITPIAVRTYKGVNNIYSDVGTTALTYRETLKHYIDKQEA